MSKSRKYPEEVLERGVRLVFESGHPIAHVAADLGVGAGTLHKRVRQAEADAGTRGDLLTTQEREEIRRLRREVFELRRANEILKAASVFSPRSSTRTGAQTVSAAPGAHVRSNPHRWLSDRRARARRVRRFVELEWRDRATAGERPAGHGSHAGSSIPMPAIPASMTEGRSTR